MFHDNVYTYVAICSFILTDTQAVPLDLRLVGGSSELEGRLEILFFGIWGTICDDFFDITNANVACRRLGFVAARSYSTSVARGSGFIWLDDVHCIGNETALEQCSHRGFGDNSGCFHIEDVGVTCISKYILRIKSVLAIVVIATYTVSMNYVRIVQI